MEQNPYTPPDTSLTHSTSKPNSIDTVTITTNTASTLLKTKPWLIYVTFMISISIIFDIVEVFNWISNSTVEPKINSFIFYAIAIALIITSTLLVLALFKQSKYISRLSANIQPDDFEKIMTATAKFWKLFGIAIILTILRFIYSIFVYINLQSIELT